MYQKCYTDWIAPILLTFVCSLSYCNSTNELEILKQRTKDQFNPGCPRGCASCSPYNGCITCTSSHHLLLRWKGTRQMGVCVRSCPAGYYSSQKHDLQKCNKCPIEHCAVCHNATVCFSCKAPRFLYEGQCVDDCAALNFIPNGDNTKSNQHIDRGDNNSSNKSRNNSNNNKTCRFRESVDCAVGDWSPWTPCMRRKSICGHKKGRQIRTRAILDLPAGSGRACPSIYEKRKCKMKYRFCEDLISANDFDFSRMMIRLSPAKWKRLMKKRENFELDSQKSTQLEEQEVNRSRKKEKDNRRVAHTEEDRELIIGNIRKRLTRNIRRSKHLKNQQGQGQGSQNYRQHTSRYGNSPDAGPVANAELILNEK